jgi:hypothetical protein
MIATQQVFVILEESLDVPPDRQDVDQSLGIQIEHGAAEVSHGFQRLVQIVGGDEHQGRPQLVDPGLYQVSIQLLPTLIGGPNHFLPIGLI